MLLCSPVSFSVKPVIAFETYNSQQKEKFSADCWIFGPPRANINWQRGLWNAMREQYWDGSQVQQPWRWEPRDLPPGNRS